MTCSFQASSRWPRRRPAPRRWLGRGCGPGRPAGRRTCARRRERRRPDVLVDEQRGEVPGSSASPAVADVVVGEQPRGHSLEDLELLDLLAEIGDLEARDRAVVALRDEGEVQDADQPAVDEVEQQRRGLAVGCWSGAATPRSDSRSGPSPLAVSAFKLPPLQIPFCSEVAPNSLSAGLRARWLSECDFSCCPVSRIQPRSASCIARTPTIGPVRLAPGRSGRARRGGSASRRARRGSP